MISTRHQFLFIHIPKTAGNSIQRSLLPYSDDQMALLQPHHDGVERFEIRSDGLDVHKHSSLAEYRAQLPHDVFKKLFVFSCIRNPWDRCVSHYFSPHRGTITFDADDFRVFIGTQVRPAAHYWRNCEADPDPLGTSIHFVIRFEHLYADFASVCEQIGLPALELPHANAASRINYRAYFRCTSTIELVRNRFRDEIDRFGYEF